MNRSIPPEVIEQVKAYLREGMTQRYIAQKVGISRSTVGVIKSGRYSLKKPKPVELSLDESLDIAKALHNHRQRASYNRARTFKGSNLCFSLKYVWRGILAEQAGIYVPPEDRKRPS